MAEESSPLRRASGLFVFPPVSAAGSPPLTVRADDLSSTKEGDVQTSHLAPLVQLENCELRDEVRALREVIRKQGEFILSLKHEIRDFLGNA
jgi:hypothetical protein